ncbi:MAG TPA: pantoate--beta-alanine ligase, partial [bacterium]|nr:pantoate--beta-alanine ligase [bacterium]
MLVLDSVENVQEMIRMWRKDGDVIGFVPTMGFLHDGHLSLVRAAKSQCERAVVSIFVNPTQFGPGEDLDAYPRDMEHDVALLEKEGVDLVFAPKPETMYARDHSTVVIVQGLSHVLAGEHRPTHFAGVTSVVAKLFNIVRPDKSYFGQKDFQQVKIIERMVRDLNFRTQVIMMPIVREPDGLAMSSRNTYLTPEQR